MQQRGSQSRRPLGHGAFVSLSFGAWVIVGLAVVSTVVVMLRPAERHAGMEMWAFARTQFLKYEPIIARWNATVPDRARMQLYLIGPEPLERRMMSGFFSGTPVADLIEGGRL